MIYCCPNLVCTCTVRVPLVQYIWAKWDQGLHRCESFPFQNSCVLPRAYQHQLSKYERQHQGCWIEATESDLAAQIGMSSLFCQSSLEQFPHARVGFQTWNCPKKYYEACKGELCGPILNKESHMKHLQGRYLYNTTPRLQKNMKQDISENSNGRGSHSSRDSTYTHQTPFRYEELVHVG